MTELVVNSPRQVLLASLAGTAIEFFDFYIYATAAVLVFPKLFFPATDPTSAILASLATFAIAFFARPIGSALFGHYGDRVGREAHYTGFMIHDGRNRLPFDAKAALTRLSEADPKLAALIARAGSFTLKLDKRASVFESLLESILYQQLHGKAAATIHRRFRELYSGDPTPQALLSTPDELLRGVGVSGNKTLAMKDLATRVLDGTVPEGRALSRMGDEEIIARLTAVRGIGRWTAEMLLIFRLGRPDVFPVTDYGVRKGFALTFQRVPKRRALEVADLPKPAAMHRRAAKWAPYRTVASWYLWRACDLAKKSEPAGRSAQ